METWINMYTIEEWPYVIRELTKLTQAEKDDIMKMQVPQLLDLVRSEWPGREKVVFPEGYHGMTVETMRERVIDNLRLTVHELKNM